MNIRMFGSEEPSAFLTTSEKPQTATSHISHWLAKIFALVVLRGVKKLLSANKYLAQRVACFRDNEL